jgi:hypothetical protein
VSDDDDELQWPPHHEPLAFLPFQHQHQHHQPLSPSLTRMDKREKHISKKIRAANKSASDEEREQRDKKVKRERQLERAKYKKYVLSLSAALATPHSMAACAQSTHRTVLAACQRFNVELPKSTSTQIRMSKPSATNSHHKARLVVATNHQTPWLLSVSDQHRTVALLNRNYLKSGFAQKYRDW